MEQYVTVQVSLAAASGVGRLTSRLLASLSLWYTNEKKQFNYTTGITVVTKASHNAYLIVA